MKLEGKLLKWVWDFNVAHQLIPKGSKVAIGASSGADSMLLIWLCHQFQRQGLLSEVRVLHFNYLSRAESLAEEANLRIFCEELHIPIFVKQEKISLSGSDFENQARKKRYDFFKEHRAEYDFLCLGHHIDDSFEWYLMNQFKSAHSPRVLGIPLKNKEIRRPLHCLTGDQIRSISKKIKLPFINDSSNRNDAFERNWMRQHIVSKIKGHYPQALKNYVIASNVEARKRGLSHFSNSKLIKEKLGNNIICLYQTSKKLRGFDSLEDQIIDVIKELNPGKRGEVRDQIQKIIKANISGKRGPFDLSGGIRCWSYPRVLIFTTKKGEKEIQGYSYKASQIPGGFKLNRLPFCLVKTKKGAMREDPLMGNLITQLKKTDWSLKTWDYQFRNPGKPYQELYWNVNFESC